MLKNYIDMYYVHGVRSCMGLSLMICAWVQAASQQRKDKADKLQALKEQLEVHGTLYCASCTTFMPSVLATIG